MPNLDRSEINRALSKAIAFKACGQERKAEAWAVRLVELLQVNAILNPQAVTYLRHDVEPADLKWLGA